MKDRFSVLQISDKEKRGTGLCEIYCRSRSLYCCVKWSENRLNTASYALFGRIDFLQSDYFS